MFNPLSHAQTSDLNLSSMLDNAANYLETVQNPDGSFGNRLSFRDTALAAEGLYRHRGNPQAIDSALAWLATHYASNCDFISRKLWVFS
jgi:hypothetical protein